MKRDPSGTLTAICMLIPMVAVPWFAIRGTQDLPSIQSRSDEPSELTYTDFEPTESDLTEAPPFPGGSSTVENNSPGEIEWEDPFDQGTPGQPEPSQPFGGPSPPPVTEIPPAVADGAFDEFDDSSSLGEPSSGLGGGQVFPGTPREVPDSRDPGRTGPPTHLSGQSKPAPPPPKNDITSQWKSMIRQLESVGMRNYRVETTEDRSEYFFTAFFQDGSTIRRIEGQGTHPLTALQSTVKQVREWRGAQ